MTQSFSETGPSSGEKEWKTISPRESRVVLKPQSWHNRTGEIVREFTEDVWLIERGYIFLKTIDVGGRTTLVKLPDGSLFVHSPLALTKVLKRCIDEIGPVRVVAAPNTEHVDFIAQWKHYYPEACFLGPPGSLEKFPHIPFTRELSRDNTLDESLADASVSQFFIGTAPFFNETVFVHHPSKTLLCTDFYWAFPRGPDVPRPTRAFGWGMDYLFKPVYERILVKDQRQFVRSLRSILSTGFDKIIPCHGDIAETGGQKILSTFFSERLSP